MYHPRPPFFPSYWTNPPPAFLPGSEREPIPGWGVNPAVVGPNRVGIGGLGYAPGMSVARVKPQFMSVRPEYLKELREKEEREEAATEGACAEAGGKWDEKREQCVAKTMPYWVWVAAALAVGGGAAVAYEMGWVGK